MQLIGARRSPAATATATKGGRWGAPLREIASLHLLVCLRMNLPLAFEIDFEACYKTPPQGSRRRRAVKVTGNGPARRQQLAGERTPFPDPFSALKRYVRPPLTAPRAINCPHPLCAHPLGTGKRRGRSFHCVFAFSTAHCDENFRFEYLTFTFLSDIIV
ncbi:hypothetical protein EVAR_32314_1 [Eumeta japonica]|uniref:Uncharacterized protein n=1 Tax=Eumeta variegata TaxID=151549 RepID=A0A4C1ZA10_EUMVA|nr:hypothetical protein EVAR_32314_1 [Eumeta japonica]